MKAISLWHPWAHCMAVGLKKIETRSWSTRYTGPLAIHAAKRPMDEDGIDLLEFVLRRGLTSVDIHYGIVAVVSLYDVVPARQVKRGVPMLEWILGDFSGDRFAWNTGCAYKLQRPVPCVGRQGIFNLPPEVESKVREQIPP